MDTTFIEAKKLLILLPPEPSLDAISAAYALAHFCEHRGTVATIACSTLITDRLTFLPQPSTVTATLGGLQDFIIQFDTTRSAIGDVRISRTEDAVEIAVTPERDFIDPRDFSFAPSRSHYDHVVIIDATTLDAIMLCGDECRAVLAETPVTSLSSTTQNPIISEHLHNIIAHHTVHNIDATTAQCLLTGIVTATNGLRSDTITSELFRTSANLMRSGGDLQTIMLALYKTVSFDFLRLWGGFLDRLSLTDTVANTHSSTYSIATAYIPSLYSADASVLAMLLARTAQFLPQTNGIVALWRETHNADVLRGMILPIDTLTSHMLMPLFETAQHTAYDTLSFTTHLDEGHIIKQIRHCAHDNTAVFGPA